MAKIKLPSNGIAPRGQQYCFRVQGDGESLVVKVIDAAGNAIPVTLAVQHDEASTYCFLTPNGDTVVRVSVACGTIGSIKTVLVQ